MKKKGLMYIGCTQIQNADFTIIYGLDKMADTKLKQDGMINHFVLFGGSAQFWYNISESNTDGR
jgi:hypothetical protein